jgi:hypothetical protein
VVAGGSRENSGVTDWPKGGRRVDSGAGSSLFVLTRDVIADTFEIKKFTFHFCAFIILYKSMSRQMQAVRATRLLLLIKDI